jgi:anti-sigma28 factor (negative regulator of flagellin synthesis)
MDINKISNAGFPVDPLKSKKMKEDEKSEVSSKEDKIEISPEAVSMFNASETKRLEEVRSKIQSGYYLQRDVTEKVADALLKEFGFSKVV